MTVLDTMQGTESRRLNDRLRKLRSSLAGMPTEATRDVVERIDDTLRIPL